MATLGTRWLVLAAAIGATLTAHAHILPIASELPAPTQHQRGRMRIPSVGFDVLLGDYLWLRVLQIVGNERTELAASKPEVQHLLESVVALDPFVDHPYRFASLWLTHDADQVRAAMRILERGIAYHPNEWRNRFYLSFSHFFYLGDTEAAARELERAVELPGAPRYLGRLLARLRSETDGLEAAAGYLAELAQQTDDPWKQAEYAKALDEIETERRARLLDQARDAYRKRSGRDIGRVEDLASGPDAVLPRLPDEPNGWSWKLDEETGQIESAFYGSRYRLNMHATDRQRVERWTGRDPVTSPGESHP